MPPLWLMVSRALEAAALVEKEGISTKVLDMHTVKPLDEEAVKRRELSSPPRSICCMEGWEAPWPAWFWKIAPYLCGS